MHSSAPSGIDRHLHHWFAALFFLCCFFTSLITPPIQSPDEPAHLRRAYLLSQGYIRLEPKDSGFGGLVDPALEKYAATYYLALAHKPEKKLSVAVHQGAASIQWSGQKEFSDNTATAPYFPLLYAPQAFGLALGESLDLTVDQSYRLARLSSLSAVCLILWLAFLIYRPPVPLLALLVIPMSMFQMTYPTLDGMANAAAIFAISCFMRIAQDGRSSKPWLLVLLAMSVFLVTACRAQLLPMLLLIFAGYFYSRDKTYLMAGVLVTGLVLTWMALAMQGVVIRQGISPREVATYYLLRPLSLLDVFANTFDNVGLLTFYATSFLGNLGWLDSLFSTEAYSVLAGFLLLIFAWSFVSLRPTSGSFAPARPSARWVLLFCSASAVFLTFLAMLVAWTPHPAKAIEGVQGRYLFVPAVMLAFALAAQVQAQWQRVINLALLVVLTLLSMAFTSQLMLDRYYIAPSPTAIPALVPKASAKLAQDQTIELLLPASQLKNPQAVQRIGILFATYRRTHSGTAILRLTAQDGAQQSIRFDLASLQDNSYRFFDVNGQKFVKAEIVFESGGGVSVWEAHQLNGDTANSCIAYTLQDSTTGSIVGCPPP